MARPMRKTVFALAVVTSIGGLSVALTDAMKMSEADMMKARDLARSQLKTG